jgi:hypothetical protein
VCVKGCDGLSDGGWQQNIIRAQVSKNLAACHPPTLFESSRLPHILLRFPPEVSAILAQDLSRSVCRAVVKHDQFDIGIILTENTPDGFIQIVPVIVSWNDDGDCARHLTDHSVLGARD